MKNKDKIIIKICKSVIVVFGVLTVFNVIMLINKKSYALFQKTIETDKVIHIETASEFPSENNGSLDELKEKTSDGIKGVDPEKGTECTENCKEYRYVGKSVNNYIYFNCTPNVEQSKKNCEMWRIVGVFKDDNNGEHLKIVKDTVLTANDIPTNYTKDRTTYKIKGSSNNTAYWNKKTSGINNNDWATAGLQYWLNGETGEGYLSKLSDIAKGMIADTEYYLGSVDTYNGGGETPKTAYEHERAVEECSGGVGPKSNSTSTAVEGNTTCRVWKGNKATWEGKVGLLYPSDYGFSANSSYWNSELFNFETGPDKTSWLQSGANHSDYEWLLSPSSNASDDAPVWYSTGSVREFTVYNNYGVRPTLYLKSNVEITDGTGEETDPYTLILN